MMRLIICLVIAVFILFAFARMQEERANALIGAFAYLHLVPFAELVRFIPSLLDVPFLGRSFFLPVVQAHDFLSDGGFAYMNEAQRSRLLDYSGRAALVIYGPALLWIGLKGRDLRPDQTFRQTHTLESMIRLQTESWVTARVARHIKPGGSVDLSARLIATQARKKIELAQSSPMPGMALPRKSISLSPDGWSRAMRPEEWLVAKGLIFNADEFELRSRPTAMARDEEFCFRADWEKLQLGSLSEVLAQQLRAPYEGPSKMRPYHQAIFAAMALFYDYKVVAGNALLAELALVADSVSCKKGRMDDALLSEKDLMRRIRSIACGEQGEKLALHAQKHAWLETAFPTFLAQCRKDRGVLPSAAFLWLKMEDRLLWYILNNVGNEAIMIEAAGAVAHWRAECQIGAPIRRPAVFQAARALLEDYLDQTPARIATRQNRQSRGRIPSEQILKTVQAHLNKGRPEIDPDGITET